MFSPRLVNDFRFGLVHINNNAINVDPVTVADAGIDRPTDNLTNSIYKFTFSTSGFQFGPTPQANQSQTQNNYNFVDDLSWVKGAHTFTVGGQYTRVRLDKLFPQVFNGQLFFTNTSATETDFGKLRGRDAGIQLRRRRRLQPCVQAEQLGGVCPGRLEGDFEPDAEPGTAHGISGGVDGRGLPHWQH